LRKARNRASFRVVSGRAYLAFCTWPFALLVGSSIALVGRRAVAEEEAVRVAYSAPEACPDEPLFVARVRTRTQHGRFAEPGELARTFDVSIAAAPSDAGFAGQIAFVDVNGERAQRNVTGATCDEVTSSLALIMALSIDDRVAQGEASVSAPSPSPQPAAPSAPPKEATPSATASPSATTARPAPKPLSLRWGIGLNGGVSTWVGPNTAPVLGGFAEVGLRERSWSARLSAFDARQTKDVSAGQQAHFATDSLRLEACPVALRVGAHVSLSPCAAFDIGVLDASAKGAAVAPRSTPPLFWAAGVALLRLGAEIKGRLILNLDGELAAPLIRNDFRIENPDGSQSKVFQIAALGVGAKAGVGVRFP
jgi:hypothetical protein